MANNLFANEIFRFVSVRAINSPEDDALNRRYVRSFIDEATIRKNRIKINPATPQTRLLILELPKLINNPQAEDEMIRMVTQFKQSSDLKLDIKGFETIFPQDLQKVYIWFRDNKDKITLKEITNRIEKAIGDKISNFLKAKNYFTNKLMLWENLIAEYINPDPPEFLDNLQDMARWFWIIEKIGKENNLSLNDDAQEISEAMDATVILPDDTVYFNNKPNEEPKTNESAPNPTNEKDLKRLKEITEAGNEIDKAHDKQTIDDTYAEKYCDDKRKETGGPNTPPVKKMSFLAARYVNSLSEKTHVIIDSYRIPKTEGVDVLHVKDRINAEKKTIIDKYYRVPKPPVIINVNNRFFQIDNLCVPEVVVDPCAPYTGATLPKGRGIIRTPGIADLKIVKTTLLRYEKGEIAHIENILKGETKVREYNITTRTEDTLVSEEESTVENEKETQTTDRFEMEKEMSSITKEDMKFDTGVKVSAKLGPVQLDTHLDFAYNKSKEESNKTATKNVQETMNRALSRVIERKKSQRTVSTIITTEDKNNHTLDNVGGADHVHGLYFWVDKYYLAKVVNYGKRLMFEFIVPEPAAFYIFSKAHKPVGENTKVKPVYPSKFSLAKLIATGGKEWTEPLVSFNDITEDNYAQLAAKYEAKEVTPPPAKEKYYATTVKHSFTGDKTTLDGNPPPDDGRRGIDISDAQQRLSFVEINKEIQLDEGYTATEARVAYSSYPNPLDVFTVDILVANKLFVAQGTNHSEYMYPSFQGFGNELKGKAFIPVSVRGFAYDFAANIVIKAEPDADLYESWKLKTFNSIISAYNAQLSQYHSWLKEQEINAGIVIEGNNPGINRKIEKEELKKHCIEMMTGQRFEKFDAMRSNTTPWGYPEFSINEASEEGKYIQFFEQAFEWEQMTYVFYPYFWGRKPNWVMIKSIDDTDPIFTSFLQAGAARVLVPARPGFERAIQYYYHRGRIWNGSNPPIPGGKLWVSMVDEIKEQQGQFEGGEQEGVPWIYKMPTSLVYLDSMDKPLTKPIYDLSDKYKNDVKAAEETKTSGDFT